MVCSMQPAKQTTRYQLVQRPLQNREVALFIIIAIIVVLALFTVFLWCITFKKKITSKQLVKAVVPCQNKIILKNFSVLFSHGTTSEMK